MRAAMKKYTLTMAIVEAVAPAAPTICAAPSILAELGLLTGRRATSNPGFQHVLAEHGAELLPDEPVVVDGNVITSQGAGTAMLFALEIVRHYLGDDAVERVRAGVVL